MLIIEIFLGMIVFLTPVMLAGIFILVWGKLDRLIELQRVMDDRNKDILSVLRTISDSIASKGK